jgi:hypothetical protein
MGQNDKRRKENRVKEEKRVRKEGVNNCRWSRIIRGERKIKKRKRGTITIVDGAE